MKGPPLQRRMTETWYQLAFEFRINILLIKSIANLTYQLIFERKHELKAGNLRGILIVV